MPTAEELERFDRCYGQEGKIYVIPDVLQPRIKAYEKKKGSSGLVCNEEKWKKAEKTGQLQGEEGEITVIKGIKAALEAREKKPGDPPAFVFHNVHLSSAGNSKKKKTKREKENDDREIDLLVLHPTLGVLLLEVKATTNTKKYSLYDDATTQLLHARDCIQEEMGDLLERDAVALTLALPSLNPENADDIRKKAEERKSAKQTQSPAGDPLMTSALGTAEQASSSPPVSGNKQLKKELLEDHPEVRLLCGSTAEVYTDWVRQLQQHRATSGHAFKGSNDQERLDNFKRACIRRCSVPALRPGQSVKVAANLHGRWLLTEEQLRVRDSRAELLHISGPRGSGKSVLLVEQGRRWLREGRRLALAVWLDRQDLLLRHLARSVCGEKADEDRVSIHGKYEDLLRMLDAASTEDPVFVILDEAGSPASFYPRLLDHVRAGRVRGLWTAYTQPLPDELETALQREGGSTAWLTSCLRCPPHVMTWTNSVRGEREPPMLPPLIPVTRELGVEVKVISHADHPQPVVHTWQTCSSCRDGLLTFFSCLGLLGGSAPSAKAQGSCAPSALSWRDVVVITTGSSDRERVADWLRGLGLPALAESGKGRYNTDVLLPGVPPQSRYQAEVEAMRSRVMSGEDRDGRPALHVVGWEDFRGLERVIVLLWHEDTWDEDRDWQSREDQDSRLPQHRLVWFMAASRCTGRLAVMVTTPSPLLPLLPAPLPSDGQSTPPFSGPGVTSAPSAQPACPPSPVYSSSVPPSQQ